MDLLADENQHPVVIGRLRDAGHSVEAVKETSPGAENEDILARPDISRLVLITYDRDFCDLIFNQGHPSPGALIYTRLSRVEPELIDDRLLAILASGVTPSHITTVTKDGVRLRPFPPGAADA